MGDHTETIQIDYDPETIRYEDLLKIFWSDHDPTGPAWGRQYRSVILTHTDAQRAAAEAGKARYAKRAGKAVNTAIEPFTTFTRAEDYHQKYTLRRWRSIAAELAAIYPDGDAFTDSTAVTRLNGYLAGYGDPTLFAREVDLLGLSSSAKAELIERRNR